MGIFVMNIIFSSFTELWNILRGRSFEYKLFFKILILNHYHEKLSTYYHDEYEVWCENGAL